MTTNSNPDTFAETMERQYAQALMTQMEELMKRNDLYLIKPKHIEAFQWLINDQCQMMLKEANND